MLQSIHSLFALQVTLGHDHSDQVREPVPHTSRWLEDINCGVSVLEIDSFTCGEKECRTFLTNVRMLIKLM